MIQLVIVSCLRLCSCRIVISASSCILYLQIGVFHSLTRYHRYHWWVIVYRRWLDYILHYLLEGLITTPSIFYSEVKLRSWCIRSRYLREEPTVIYLLRYLRMAIVACHGNLIRYYPSYNFYRYLSTTCGTTIIWYLQLRCYSYWLVCLTYGKVCRYLRYTACTG